MHSQKCYLLAAGFHLAAIAWYYSITFEPDHWVGGHLFAILHRRHSFLTNITFEVSLAYFLYYAHRQQAPIYSQIFEKLCVVASFVTFGYWLAYFALGDKIDTDLPLLLNLCLHGGNAFVLFMSRHVTSMPYYRPSTVKQNIWFGAVTGVLYQAVMALHKWRFGFEVYSFFDDLSILEKMALNIFWMGWVPVCSMIIQRRYYPGTNDFDNFSDTVSEACTEMTDFDFDQRV